jgi:hypothetical protein
VRPAPEPTPHARLHELQRRWQSEERAIATVLGELEADLEELLRDVAFQRIVGEQQPQLLRRCAELRGECEALATELAHVRLALVGVTAELLAPDPADCGPWFERTPA